MIDSAKRWHWKRNPVLITLIIMLLLSAVGGGAYLLIRSFLSHPGPIYIGQNYPEESVTPAPVVAPTPGPQGGGGPVDQATEQAIRNFVHQFISDLTSNDSAQRAAYFTNPCRYFEKPSASTEDLRKEFEAQMVGYQVRNYTLVAEPLILKTGDSAFTAAFHVEYRFENPKPAEQGVMGIKLILQPVEGSYRISSMERTTAAPPASETPGATHHKTHHRRKR